MKVTPDRIYTYHPPHGTQQERYIRLREGAKVFDALVRELSPPSREQSLALTDIQRACQMANAAIAINEVAPVESVPSQQATAEPVATTQESL